MFGERHRTSQHTDPTRKDMFQVASYMPLAVFKHMFGHICIYILFIAAISTSSLTQHHQRDEPNGVTRPTANTRGTNAETKLRARIHPADAVQDGRQM